MLHNLLRPKHSLWSNAEKGSKNPQKPGKNRHSDPLNFRMIDFGVISTSYVHINGVSTII
jgi:hypothetical protein